MANNEHVAVVRRGAAALAAWRLQNPDVRLRLEWAILRGSDLRGADLRGAELLGANLYQADCGGANLRFADLRLANLTLASFSGADLSGAGLTEALLRGADLSSADLSGVNLAGADLARANLSGARLGQTDFAGADLSAADLSGADLSGADLSGANLSHADLTGADLTKAQVGWTRFATVNLASVRGLETVRHRGPSTIGIDTLYLSLGSIPAQFLRGAGVQETYLYLTHELVSKPIDFASCFISYSVRDQEFAERLHTDLQASGVRSWFAPEDLASDEHHRAGRARSVRAFDKLVLILSDHSIGGGWVASSVETALERERRLAIEAPPGLRHSAVLFPVRLDAGAVEADRPWAHDIRRTRHIGDFTRWKDQAAYTLAFDRLLHDLTNGASNGPNRPL